MKFLLFIIGIIIFIGGIIATLVMLVDDWHKTLSTFWKDVLPWVGLIAISVGGIMTGLGLGINPKSCKKTINV